MNRRDIPTVGTGPVVGDYFAYDRPTGAWMRLTDFAAAREDVVLLVVPPEHLTDEDTISNYMNDLHEDRRLNEAPTLAEVIDLARNERLSSSRPVTPEVRRAIEAGRRALS